jgi:hypothetical protein
MAISSPPNRRTATHQYRPVRQAQLHRAWHPVTDIDIPELKSVVFNQRPTLFDRSPMFNLTFAVSNRVGSAIQVRVGLAGRVPIRSSDSTRISSACRRAPVARRA